VHKCRHPRAGSAIYFIAIKRSVPMRLPALLACTRLRSRRSLWAMLHSSMRPGPRHASLTTLISHLGCEPQGGLYARGGTPAVRLLFDLVREADKGSGSSPADSYMQLAVYDLLGALFAPSDPSARSRVTGNKPATERDRLRLWLSRLYPFRPQISPAVRLLARRRSAGHGRAGDAIVRAGTGESASWAHDIQPLAT